MNGRKMQGIARWRFAPVFLGVLSFAAILLVWESSVRLGWVNPFFVSQPSAIAASLTRTAQSGELWRNLAVSLREFAVGYGASVAVGILTGALAGRFRTVEYAMDPFLWFLYSAPLIAFYPLFVLWFGLGDSHRDRDHIFALRYANRHQHPSRISRTSILYCFGLRDPSGRLSAMFCGKSSCRPPCRW